MGKALELAAVEPPILAGHVPDGVQLSFAERVRLWSRLSAILVAPQFRHNRAHVPSTYRLREQGSTERGQVMALCIVEKLMQLLDADAGESFAQGRSDVMCGGRHGRDGSADV